MTNLLKNMTIVLNESEDLFPGLTSSAFDEHNTLRNTKRSSSDESEWLDKHLERVKLLEKSKSGDFNRIKQFMMNNDLFIHSWNVGPGDVKYKSITGLVSKFPLSYDVLANVSFKPSSPVYSNIPNYITKMERALERMAELKAKLKKMKTRASSVRRAATAAAMKKQQSSASKATIPESSIPKKILVKFFDGNVYKQVPAPEWVTENKDNPYWSANTKHVVIEKYAGHPAHFDWQKREKTQYFLLSKFVENLGLPELSVLYLKRHDATKKPVFYMANADKSFQMFQGEWSSKDIYTKDTSLNTWDFITVDTIVKWRDEIDLNTNLINKYGKKP